MSKFSARVEKLRRLLKKHRLPGLLATCASNVSYLTGFTGHDTWLAVTAGDCVAVSDARYATQLEEECPGLDVHIRLTGKGTSLPEAAASVLAKLGILRLGFEADWMTVATHADLAGRLPKVALASTSNLVEELREIKDADEIAEIRRAVRQAEQAFAIIKSGLRPEKTEKQIADDLEHQLRLLGAKGSAFEPIVAVGARAALPHAVPGDAKIADGDLVLIDWGATARQYRSDLTRVLTTAKISPKLERVYGVVLNAQRAAIQAIRPGVLGKDVDAAARSIISKAGFGKNFGHGTGHGVGLDIHESPRLNATSDRPLKAGMVVTVEPGIYLPGWGGVRIEDDILVTKSGHEVLSDVPKELGESRAA